MSERWLCGMQRVQFTAWDRDNFPKVDNDKFLFYEVVSTGLSTETCAYVYKGQNGFLTKNEVIAKYEECLKEVSETAAKSLAAIKAYEDKYGRIA